MVLITKEMINTRNESDLRIYEYRHQIQRAEEVLEPEGRLQRIELSLAMSNPNQYTTD